MVLEGVRFLMSEVPLYMFTGRLVLPQALARALMASPVDVFVPERLTYHA